MWRNIESQFVPPIKCYICWMASGFSRPETPALELDNKYMIILEIIIVIVCDGVALFVSVFCCCNFCFLRPNRFCRWLAHVSTVL